MTVVQGTAPAATGPDGTDRRRPGGTGVYKGIERRAGLRDEDLVGGLQAGDAQAPAPTSPPPGVAGVPAVRGARRRLTGAQLLLVLDTAAVAATTAAFRGATPFVLLATAATLLAFTLVGLYRPRLTRSALDDAPHILGASLLATASAVLTWGVLTEAPVGRRDLLAALVVAAAVAVLRAVGYLVIARWRRARVARPTLVLGAGVVAARLGRSMAADRTLGLELVGYLDDDPMLGHEELGGPVLGDMTTLADTIVARGVTDVFVAFGSMSSASMVEVLRTCDRLSCEIFFVPRLFELHAMTRDTDQVHGLPVVRARRATYRWRSWGLKRVLDLVVAAVALLVVSPVLAVCAVLVRREGGPGIFFRQTRIGLDGREFEIIKFRSMRPATVDESQTLWNISVDDRVGPVGRVLRKTSLDELPQLWNIVRGDMSLVGPRPERPHFVHQFQAAYPSYTARSRVPAGLTGLAAVNGLRGDTSIEDRARYDNLYVENWSLWLDVKILLRTVQAVLRRTGG